jgi:hypothetical protein
LIVTKLEMFEHIASSGDLRGHNQKKRTRLKIIFNRACSMFESNVKTMGKG